LTIFNKKNFFSLRARFIILTVIPLLIIIGLITVFNIARERENTLPRLVENAEFHVLKLNEIFINDGIINKEILIKRINERINKKNFKPDFRADFNYVFSNTQIAAAFIFDENKNILISFDLKKPSSDLMADPQNLSAAPQNIMAEPQAIRANGSIIIESKNHISLFKPLNFNSPIQTQMNGHIQNQIQGHIQDQPENLFISVVISLETMNKKIKKVIYENIVISIIAVFFGILTSIFLSKIILEPITKMNCTIKKISQGDLNAKSEIIRQDELGNLAQFINRMIENLKTQKENDKKNSENEKMANLGKLAANLAHEIKNPLAIIKSMNQILLDELSHNASHCKKISIVLDEADRVTKVIDQLLDFAKMRPSTPIQINPEKAVKNIISCIQFMASEKGCTLKLIKSVNPDSLPDIFMDTEQLKMVLVNLIINSLNNEAKKIHIYVEKTNCCINQTINNQETPAVKELENNDFNITINIKDNGKGVDKAIEDKIFEPFITGSNRGTGLGLSISRAMIKANGGQILFKGQGIHERGASFQIILPIAG
jgi:signal transduction histidine kinase